MYRMLGLKFSEPIFNRRSLNVKNYYMDPTYFDGNEKI